nr:hypothetical protein [Tanacetum cinerariifolium]
MTCVAMMSRHRILVRQLIRLAAMTDTLWLETDEVILVGTVIVVFTCVWYDAVSERMVESKNYLPQQPPQAHPWPIRVNIFLEFWECRKSRAFGQEKGQPQLGSLMPKGLSHEVEWSLG